MEKKKKPIARKPKVEETPEIKKKKGKGGRPPMELNWKQFEMLCSFQCTLSEIGSFFSIDKVSLIRIIERHYQKDMAVVYQIYSESGLCSLRRTQFALSKKNAQMAIHLGKVYLKQHEIIVNKNEVVPTQKTILELPDNGHRFVKDDTTEN